MTKTSTEYYTIKNSELLCSISLSSDKPFGKKSAYQSLMALYEGKKVRQLLIVKTGIGKKTKEIAQEIYENYEKKWCFLARWWDNFTQLFIKTERGQVYDIYKKILIPKPPAPKSPVTPAETDLKKQQPPSHGGEDLGTGGKVEIISPLPTPPSKSPMDVLESLLNVGPYTPAPKPLTQLEKEFNTSFQTIKDFFAQNKKQQGFDLAKNLIFESGSKFPENSIDLVCFFILKNYFKKDTGLFAMEEAVAFIETPTPAKLPSEEGKGFFFSKEKQQFYYQVLCQERIDQNDLESAAQLIKKIDAIVAEKLYDEMANKYLDSKQYKKTQECISCIADPDKKDSLIEKLLEQAIQDEDIVRDNWPKLTCKELKLSLFDKIFKHHLPLKHYDLLFSLIALAKAESLLGSKEKDYLLLIAKQRFDCQEYSEACELFIALKGIEGVDEYLQKIAKYYLGNLENPIDCKKAQQAILAIHNAKVRDDFIHLLFCAYLYTNLAEAEEFINVHVTSSGKYKACSQLILVKYLKDSADANQICEFIKRLKINKGDPSQVRDGLREYAIKFLLGKKRIQDAQTIAKEISDPKKREKAEATIKEKETQNLGEEFVHI